MLFAQIVGASEQARIYSDQVQQARIYKRPGTGVCFTLPASATR